MQLATVIGHSTATVKHPSMQGWKLIIVQPLLINGNRDGEPLIAIDELGSRAGQQVIISSDGKAVTEAMGTKNTPVRWMVIGHPDDHGN